MPDIPIFDEDAIDRISKAVRDLEDIKKGFPNLVRELLPDLFDDVVTINVIEVTDDLEETPGHWPGVVRITTNTWDDTVAGTWGVLQLNGRVKTGVSVGQDQFVYVIPLPVTVPDGTAGPGTLKAGMYVGVLWGVTDPSPTDDNPIPTEVYLAVGAVGGTGGGLVARSVSSGPGPVYAKIQTTDDSGVLIDDPSIVAEIQIRKFPAPAREDFELDGQYPVIKVGDFYFAETGPKTACEEIVTRNSIAILDCTTLQITYTNTKLVRFIDRPCSAPATPTRR